MVIDREEPKYVYLGGETWHSTTVHRTSHKDCRGVKTLACTVRILLRQATAVAFQSFRAAVHLASSPLCLYIRQCIVHSVVL
jgi:hypothetical protein